MYKIPKYVNKYVDIRASGEYNVHARPAQKQNAVCFTCIIALAAGFRQQRGCPWIAVPAGTVTHVIPFFRSYSIACRAFTKQTSVSSFLAWSEHSFPAYCHVGLFFNPVVLCLLPLILRVFFRKWNNMSVISTDFIHFLLKYFLNRFEILLKLTTFSLISIISLVDSYNP